MQKPGYQGTANSVDFRTGLAILQPFYQHLSILPLTFGSSVYIRKILYNLLGTFMQLLIAPRLCLEHLHHAVDSQFPNLILELYDIVQNFDKTYQLLDGLLIA